MHVRSLLLGIFLMVCGAAGTLAVLWRPTTVVVGDGGAEIRIYARHLTAAEEDALSARFASANRDGWLLWSSVADPLTVAQQGTHPLTRWIPIQAYRDETACQTGRHTLESNILAIQDPQFARWLPFTDCVRLGQHPDDSNPLTTPFSAMSSP